MRKEFATDDHAEVIDAAGGSAFQFFERSDQITKSASDVISKKDVNDHMPPDGMFGVHLISLGAEEHYGCVACDTPILLPDGSHTDFSQIQVGDVVLSGEGRPKAVNHIFAYDATEVVKVRVGGMAKDIVASVDHPFRTADFEQFVCKRDRWRRCLPASYGQQNICKRSGGCALGEGDYPVAPVHDYKQAQELRPRDYLVYRLPDVEPEVFISDDEAVMIGYFLAEGSFSRNNNPNGQRQISGLRFDFDLAEKDTFVAELVAAARRCGWNANVYGPYESGPNELVVVVNGNPERARQYAEWFSSDGASSKKLPIWCLGLPRSARCKLLESYLKGDAAITDPEQCCATTASYDLASGIQKLLWSLGIAATSCYYEVGERPNATTVKTGFKGYRVNYAYTRVPVDCAELLFGNTPDKQQHKVHLFIIDRDVFLPIRNIETIEWNDKVYTLEVEDDHSYVSAGVWSRNCNRNGDSWSNNSLDKYHQTFEKYGTVFREHKNRDPKTQGVGQVKLAKFNKNMHRGELIVWVDKEKAPDMYKQAKAGKELSFSMSCRLPADRCSCCDAKAKRTTDYCTHLKNHMLKYVPEFRKYAYARNEDDVKFFDISEVKRRADRIATFLGYSFSPDDMAKAASDERVITGTDWAEFYGNVEPAVFAPWEADTLHKMAAELQFVKHADQNTLDTLVASLPRPLSTQDLATLAKADFRSVGGELAKRAMILDFASFASIITDETVEDLRKQADFRDVEGLKLPELLEAMEENEGCMCGDEAATAVAPDPYGTAFSSEKDSIDNLMEDVAESLDLKPKAVAERALTITIKMASIPQTAARKQFDPVFNAMAEAYGHYLVKAAHIAKDVPGVSPTLLFRSIAARQIFPAQKGCQ